MLIVELALQGLRGLPPLFQVPLLPGVNVIRTGDARMRRTIVDALFHSLHPDAAQSEVLGALVEPGPGPARTALTLQSRDGGGFRVMREMTAGGARLLRYSKESQQFKNLSQDPGEVAQYLRVQLGLPSESSYERLFVMSPDSMAYLLDKARSRRGGSLYAVGAGGARGGVQAAIRPPSATFGFEDYGAAPAGQPPGVGYGGVPLPRAGSTFNPTNALVRSGLDAAPLESEFENLETKRAEYKRLRKLLEATRSAQGMHQELDKLTQRRRQIEASVEHVRAVSREVDELRLRADTFGDVRELPPGMGDRLRSYETASAKFQVDLARLVEEQREAQRSAADAAPRPLTKDPYFMGGVGAMILFISIAFLLDRPALALLNILGALVASAAAFHYVAGLERQGRHTLRSAVLTEREAKLQKQQELETGVTKKLLGQLKLESAAEVLERIQEAEGVFGALSRAESELAGYEADPQHRAEIEELSAVKERMEEIEASLGGIESSSSANMSTPEMIRRIEALAREIHAAGGSTGDLGPGLGTPSARAASAAGIRVVTGDLAPRPVPGLEPDEDDGEGYGGGYGSGRPARSSKAPTGGGQGAAGLYAIGGFGGPPGGFGGPPGGYGGGYGSTGGYAPEGIPVDPTPLLAEALAEVLVRSFESVSGLLVDRLKQYFEVLVPGFVERIEFGARGELRLHLMGAHDPTPFYALPEDKRRLVDAALRLTWLEQAAAKARVPVLIDDPFIGLGAPERRAFRQTLGYVSKAAQVLVLTSENDIEGNPVDLSKASKTSMPPAEPK
ncbi:MAG: hypothetical protein U1E65_26515 [Myxococcota bacterium]